MRCGTGFATAPDTGHDVVMVVSHDGHGLSDAVADLSCRRSPEVVAPAWPNDRILLSRTDDRHTDG
ncbi:hypothetical protein ACGFZS_12355 [Streptomyces sp. NPDC048288]|uniref:hypothetical protein n=1 Tax=Streptomyces sp. NPDC048288 TaxID=3365529 RepID=UPI00371A2730